MKLYPFESSGDSAVTPLAERAAVIGVVTNPHAAGNKRHPGIHDDLARIVGDRGLVRETQSIDEIPDVAEEFRKAGVDVLCINGGDGTAHATLSAFYQRYNGTALPKFLALRGGTMNTVPTSYQLKGSPTSLLTQAVQCVSDERPVPTFKQKTLRVGSDLGFIFGAGAVSNFLEQYYDGPRRGPGKAAYVVARALCNAPFGARYLRDVIRPVHADVALDGAPAPMTDYSVLFASTVEQIGIGVRVSYRANESREHFHYIGAKLTPFELVKFLPRIWRGKPIHHPLVVDRIAQELTMTPHTAVDNGRHAYFTLDGELYSWTEPVRVTLGPTLDAVKF